MAEALKAASSPRIAELNRRQRIQGSNSPARPTNHCSPTLPDHANAFQMLSADFVATDSGTGIVHMAPAYGEDDFAVCKEAGIELVDGLDAEGNFLPVVSDFAGRNCKEADGDIIRWIKQQGRLQKQSTIMHSYPFCERTETR